MKILIIGDLHGRMPRIHYKDFDAIIFVGDVCDDRKIKPLKDAWIRYLDKHPENQLSMDEYIVGKIGRKKMKEYEKDSVRVGRRILKYLNSFGKPVFMVPGNWDESYGPTKIKNMDKNDYNYFKAFLDFWNGDKINPKLVKGLKNIRDCQYQLNEFMGLNIFGYGLSSNKERPRLRKGRKYSKEEMKKLNNAYRKLNERLKNVYLKRNTKFPSIFITHNVPHNTPLDIIKLKGTKINGKHFGSSVAREFVDKYQPMLCIGGHMHEHFKKCKIKKTVAINAGYGKDANILLEINDKNKKIKKITFYGGMKG